MKCYVHQDAEAVGTCTGCGKAICPECSMEIGGKLVCKPCAEKLASQCMTAKKKDPVLALLLSLVGGLVSGLLIGLGQIYNGQIKKGIILSLLHIFAWVIIVGGYVLLSIITLGIGAVVCLPIFLFPLLLWVYTLYDAYVTADRINKGDPVKDWLD
jgi:hypothetical protein